MDKVLTLISPLCPYMRIDPYISTYIQPAQAYEDVSGNSNLAVSHFVDGNQQLLKVTNVVGTYSRFK